MGENTEPRELAPAVDDRVYCMRCRARRALIDARRVVLRSGRPVLKGRCPVCGAPLFRIGVRVARPG